MNPIRTAAYILKSAEISKSTRRALEKAQKRWFNAIDSANRGEWLGASSIDGEFVKAVPIIERAIKEHYGGDLNNKRTGRFSEFAGVSAHTLLPLLLGVSGLAVAQKVPIKSDLGKTLCNVGPFLGAAASLGSTLGGGIMGDQSNRTLEEQFEQNEKPSYWKNLLIPGHAAYNEAARRSLYTRILSDPYLEEFSED